MSIRINARRQRKENRMKRLFVPALVVAVAVSAWSVVVGAKEEVSLPSKSDESCLKCHQYDKMANLFAGKLVDVSEKAKTIQLGMGKSSEVIYFDDATALKNAPSLKEIKKGESVRITYFKKDGRAYAKEVEVKKGLEVPKEQLASVEEIAALVAQGPEKGKYILLDSRPPVRFNEGHIPTSKNLLFFSFDADYEKVLPPDKEILQIYYCDGFT
jgi:hypothetical protein